MRRWAWGSRINSPRRMTWEQLMPLFEIASNVGFQTIAEDGGRRVAIAWAPKDDVVGLPLQDEDTSTVDPS